MLRLTSTLLLLLSVALISSCDGLNKQVLTGASCADDELRAAKQGFEQMVYRPFFRQTNSCANCHLPGGKASAQGDFAHPDPSRAYFAALGNLDLADPSNPTPPSLGYGAIAHDGVASTYVSENAPAYRAALTEWAALENTAIAATAECASSGGNDSSDGAGGDDEPEAPPAKPYKTIGTVDMAQALAAVPETNVTTVTTLTLPMTSLDPISAGASFTVRVRRLSPRTANSAGSYLFFDPRIITPRPLRVKDIRISIAAASQLYNLDIYNGVNQIVATNTAGVVLSTASDSLLRPDASGEVLKVEILEIGSGNTACSNLPNFVSLVKPVMGASCVSCHNNTANPAFNAFRMNPADDAATCSSLKVRMSNPAAQSMAIVYPATRSYPTKPNQHPAIAFSAASRESFVNWFNSEN